MISQQELYDYLLANPLNVDVNIGALQNMNGKDYIFLDYLTDTLIPSNDKGCHQTSLQITIATKDFERRKTLVAYVKQKLNVLINYDTDNEFEYFVARCECGVLMRNDLLNV